MRVSRFAFASVLLLHRPFFCLCRGSALWRNAWGGLIRVVDDK